MFKIKQLILTRWDTADTRRRTVRTPWLLKMLWHFDQNL